MLPMKVLFDNKNIGEGVEMAKIYVLRLHRLIESSFKGSVVFIP